MTILLIVISVLSVLVLLGSLWLGERKFKRVEDRYAAPIKAKPKKQMSWVGRVALEKYNSLPESHKPSYDVRAAVEALDVKYQIVALDSHFNIASYLYGRPICQCQGRDKDKCKRYPEFIELWDGLQAINRALQELKRAEAERERAIEVAGVENDLRSVDDILAAFRSEAKIITEVAREIRP